MGFVFILQRERDRSSCPFSHTEIRRHAHPFGQQTGRRPCHLGPRARSGLLFRPSVIFLSYPHDTAERKRCEKTRFLPTMATMAIMALSSQMAWGKEDFFQLENFFEKKKFFLKKKVGRKVSSSHLSLVGCTFPACCTGENSRIPARSSAHWPFSRGSSAPPDQTHCNR